MYQFEQSIYLPDTKKLCYKNISRLISLDSFYEQATDVNVDGTRTQFYGGVINICNILSTCCFYYLTTYCFTLKKFKFWANMPHQFQSHLRNHICKIMVMGMGGGTC